MLLWLFSALASILRGTGNMRLPAIRTTLGAIILIRARHCSSSVGGRFSALGVAGGGAAVILYYVGGCAVLAARVMSDREVVRPRWHGVTLRFALVL